MPEERLETFGDLSPKEREFCIALRSVNPDYKEKAIQTQKLIIAKAEFGVLDITIRLLQAMNKENSLFEVAKGLKELDSLRKKQMASGMNVIMWRSFKPKSMIGVFEKQKGVFNA